MSTQLKDRFNQKCGMPVAVVIGIVLIKAANSEKVELPDEFQMYSNDIDLDRLNTQLSMLPDLITTINSTAAVPIKQVSNARTISEVNKITEFVIVKMFR